MVRKWTRSGDHLSFAYIDTIYAERKDSLKSFFVPQNEAFIGYLEKELKQKLDEHLQEAERDACMTLFAALEAALRIDCRYCCDRRPKHDRARRIRDIVSETPKDSDVPLTKLIEVLDIPNKIKDSLRKFFLYRHWLAHGRYWKLQTGIPAIPGFVDVYEIAADIPDLLHKYS